jgi:hypothetical protein
MIKVYAEQSTNIFNDSDYSQNTERINGSQPNTSISSKLINTVLRLTSLNLYGLTEGLRQIGGDTSNGPGTTSSLDSTKKYYIDILTDLIHKNSVVSISKEFNTEDTFFSLTLDTKRLGDIKGNVRISCEFTDTATSERVMNSFNFNIRDLATRGIEWQQFGPVSLAEKTGTSFEFSICSLAVGHGIGSITGSLTAKINMKAFTNQQVSGINSFYCVDSPRKYKCNMYMEYEYVI